jgi:transposase InsO family protein
MRQLGFWGATRAKKRFTTKSDPTHVRAPDLVNRDFSAPRPDALWVADFTYCSTWSGIIYVAFIIDVHSRRLVGWKAARSMTASLVVDALNMAAWTRRHTSLEGLICHTDAGSQGGFKRRSQHLDDGGVKRWASRNSRRRHGRCGASSGLPDGHLVGSATSDSGSGSGSRRARRVRTQLSQWAWHPRLALGGSERLAGCVPLACPRCPAVT